MNANTILLMAWVIVITVFLSRFTKGRKERKDHVTALKANDFRDLKNKNQLIDVRDKEAFKTEHIVGARNITMDQIKNGVDRKLFKNKPVYIYCESGKRAGKAATLLVKQGFNDIIIMKDSLSNYTGKKQSS